MANEYSSGGRTRSIMTQIGGQRRANVRWQRQRSRLPALSANEDLPGTPVDIVQIQPNDFTSPYTEPGEQKQKGMIPPAGRSFSIATFQNAFHVGGRKIPWQRGQRPVGDGRHTTGKILGDRAAVSQIAEE